MHPFYPFMLKAVALSRQGFGHTMPNPCVGALLVKDGCILAEGWHRAAGGAHAEVAALKDAVAKGVAPAECSLVVTLEPCNHYGKTPPCAKAILDAGIRHVVIGAMDPNPQAAGGADFLSSRGIRVECGIAERECQDNIADFLAWQREKRPYVTLKLASTLDGRIATRSGHSKWISGEQAIQRVHELRSQVQAVMVGGNTFYADNPSLTCRLDSLGRFNHLNCASPVVKQPLAVIATTSLPEHPENFTLLQERPQDVIFLTSAKNAKSAVADMLRQRGSTIYAPDAPNEPDGENGDYVADGLKRLHQNHQVYYLLCEGGGKLGMSLLTSGLADELRLHLSPKIIGDAKAKPLFDGLRPESMNEALRLRFIGTELCGEDILLQLRRQA
ncbi:MAG: bifunctional diaminohydroxyphosphoribosylaminopyrimidine deaminase/5-amino-6-(5-phosphoribosylamino)uracil reductase RibD [Deltaproteobacteria bacterium]|jgi:diaminohydroxyphosphoribosylaminopyrimidine deaminase/5-amino-6-(5-phosphoribosylamino)uracil reductase|nr:bifunctional diaminohydroxyphosphoribosylaminopyrimidine deaminase/5-amino-6-(5-phosphoribosylamino)uracil reductase RibD [Deltaproteobacteria bacterium]